MTKIERARVEGAIQALEAVRNRVRMDAIKCTPLVARNFKPLENSVSSEIERLYKILAYR